MTQAQRTQPRGMALARGRWRNWRAGWLSVAAALVAALFAALPGCGGGTGGQAQGDAQLRYYAAWRAAINDAAEGMPGSGPAAPEVFSDQSVRQVLRLSLGGEHVRIRLSNLFGSAPLTFTGVHVARAGDQGTIVAGSDRTVLFDGRDAVTVAAGAERWSDPVALPVAPLSNLAVTLYFAAPSVLSSVHAVGRQHAYLGAGNQLAAASLIGASTRLSYYGVSAVETASAASAPAHVVVAFGDSLTDGEQSSVDADRRYPDQLDERLKAAGLGRIGVVNAGMAGNRWLHDLFGPSATSRFARDVLDVAGVSHVIILLGINDIGFSVLAPSQEVSAGELAAAIDAAVASAKSRGIKVLLATLPPYKGAFYYSPAGEAKRQAVNAHVRTHRGIDGVVDFDRALRNSLDPEALDPAYDSGDHLHPNDAGYGAMAAAVDLERLRP